MNYWPTDCETVRMEYAERLREAEQYRLARLALSPQESLLARLRRNVVALLHREPTHGEEPARGVPAVG